MKIRFHVRLAAISNLSHTAIHLGILVVVATLLSLGSPLNLSEYFPASFAQFFVWLCAFPLLTFFAVVASFVDFSKIPLCDFFTTGSMQMFSIGVLAILDVLISWAFVRYIVLKAWGVEWVKAGTTILKCFVIWGYFQLICAILAFAWSMGGFKLPNRSNEVESPKTEQSVQIPENA